MNEISLRGDIGPDYLDTLGSQLDAVLRDQRPLIEIDLTEVTDMHLSIVNTLVKARRRAQDLLGDISVVVGSDSTVQHLMAQVGIVGTIRP